MRKKVKVAFLTGDVHHPLSPSRWDLLEPQFALEYCTLLRELGIKGTLFITGRCLQEHKVEVSRMASFEGVELGAHTYYAFFPFKNVCVPYCLKLLDHKLPIGFYPFYDAWRCVVSFKEFGLSPISWRTHAYQGFNALYHYLARLGFRVVSDWRSLDAFSLRKSYSMLHVPITCPTDEEIIATGDNRAWLEKFWGSLRKQAKLGNPIVMQLHPKRMKMLDNYRMLRKIIKFLLESGYCFENISSAPILFKEVIHGNW